VIFEPTEHIGVLLVGCLAFQSDLRNIYSNTIQWLKRLLTVSTWCDDDALNSALWILKALASEYEVEFIQAAKDAGYPSIVSIKMDEATAAAMWFDSNTLKKN
jgi:hypothetical protein